MPFLTAPSQCVFCGEAAIGSCEYCPKTLCADCALLINAPGNASGGYRPTIADGSIFSVIHSLRGDDFPMREEFLTRIVGNLTSQPNILCVVHAIEKMNDREGNSLRVWWAQKKKTPIQNCGICQTPTTVVCRFCRKPRCQDCSVSMGAEVFPGQEDVLSELGWDGKHGFVCQACILTAIAIKGLFDTWWKDHKKVPEGTSNVAEPVHSET